jgi:myosin heavy subunit
MLLEKKNGVALCQVVQQGKQHRTEDETAIAEQLIEVKLSDYRGFELPRQNEATVSDMMDLPFLHEPGVYYNLRDRYVHHQHPYTRSGDMILVSMNPFFWRHKIVFRGSSS